MNNLKSAADYILSPFQFVKKLVERIGIAVVILTISLGVGALGYRITEGMEWLDATLNAAMILTGMGPVAELTTPSGKIFAIGYSLFSGLIFIGVAAIIIEPFITRVLRRLRVETAGR